MGPFVAREVPIGNKREVSNHRRKTLFTHRGSVQSDLIRKKFTSSIAGMVFTASPRRRLGDAKASRRLPNGGVLPATPFLRMASPCAERRRQGVGWTPRRPPKSKAGPRGGKKQARSRPLSVRRGKSRHLARGKGEGSARAGRER